MRERGFTLIELMIVLTVFGLILGAIFAVMYVGKQSWSQGGTKVEIQQEARRAMEEIVRELRESAQDVVTGVLADGTAYNAITFRMPDDIDGDGDVLDANGVIEWGTPISFSVGGINNEQLLRTSAGNTTVLGNHVVSLQFTRNAATPNVIEIDIQTQRTSQEQRVFQAALSSKVTLRN
ncbi:MAG: type II secretion system protein [Candidatus Omnitrophota bacterium]